MKERVFRIITDGEKFRVQEQGRWGSWKTLGHDEGGYHSIWRPYEFGTRQQAEVYVRDLGTVTYNYKPRNWITT